MTSRCSLTSGTRARRSSDFDLKPWQSRPSRTPSGTCPWEGTPSALRWQCPRLKLPLSAVVPAQRLYVSVQPHSTMQTIMTHIIRLSSAWLLEGAGMYEDEDNDGRFPTRPGRSPLPAQQAEGAERPRTAVVAAWNDGRTVRPGRTVCVCRGPRVCRPARRPTGTAARPAVISTTRAALGTARRSGRGPHPVVPPRQRGPGRAEPGAGPSAVPGFLVPAGYGPSALFRVGRVVPTMMV